jgi:ABC-type branched-subunit amino acid transport system ATPase component
MPLLELVNVEAGYGDADLVLRGLSFGIEAGELAVVIGPNGAGKSTALKALSGQLPIRGGEIKVAGEVVASRSVARLHPALAYVPQEANVFPSMTVRENLEMGGYAIRGALRPRIERVLARFPLLAERQSAPARTLSGGQRQILALALAMMVDPKVLLLDEPSAGLSPIAAQAMFETVVMLHREGITIVMVEQNALAALALATRGIVLVMGETRMNAPARAVAEHPEIRRLFLGGS